MSDIKPIVLRRMCEDAGLCSFLYSYITAIIRYNNLNRKIIVDMKNCNNLQFNNQNSENINIWELFFEQPYDISLEDISDFELKEQCGNFVQFDSNNISSQDIDIIKQRIRIKENIKEEVKLFFNNNLDENTLGVMVRGTDRRIRIVPGHGIQTDIDEIIEDIKGLIPKYNISKIFLMTEQKEYEQKFKDTLNVPIISYQTIRFPYIKTKISDMIKDMPYENKITLNKQYFISLMILMMCNYRILGQTSTSEVYKLLKTNNNAIYEKIYKETF